VILEIVDDGIAHLSSLRDCRASHADQRRPESALQSALHEGSLVL
jgi:hypothetical protein